MSLYESELKDTLDSNLEIDIYEGKLIDTSIVVVFKSKQKMALIELESFLENSSINIIDSETAEYPNTNEDYLLFLEFERHPLFTKRMMQMVEHLKFLTETDKWTFTTLYQTTPLELTEDNLKRALPLMTKELKRQQLIKNFFENSKTKPTFDFNYIIFEILKTKYIFNFIEEMPKDKIHRYIDKYGIDPNFSQSTIGKQINKIFGENWDVVKIGNVYIFKNETGRCIAMSQKRTTVKS